MTLSPEAAIGIFDSGVGGLTVLAALCRHLPNENILYLGDTARVPYGTKSPEVVLKYALQDALFMLDRGVKAIVIACNTASAFALEYLQGRLKVPVIGVIEPGAAAAVAASAGGRIGIIGTEGTIRSQAYERVLKRLRPDVTIAARATPLFVPLIEEGLFTPAILKPVIHHYLSELKGTIDTLILGCTHYPLLTPALEDYFSGQVKLVDSASAIAVAVADLLAKHALHSPQDKAGKVEVCVTDAPERVKKIATAFLNKPSANIVKVDL